MLMARNLEVVKGLGGEVGGVSGEGLSGKSGHELVDRWGVLNLWRGGLPLLGCLVGFWATVF